jgi:anhydro-N-acetylmuramic acid kinase
MPVFMGLISGTSMDAIDAALIDILPTNIQLLSYQETPYSQDLRAQLEQSVTANVLMRPRDIGVLSARVGREFAAAATHLLETSDVERSDIVAIGCHGQTLAHHPEVAPPFSMQIGDPNIVALQTGIPTVADFRNMDMAAGGQGAPLVPPFHAALFSQPGVAKAVVNIGGIANVTLLPSSEKQPLIAFDTGPGNTLMDNWIGVHHGRTYDHEGKWASSGQIDVELLDMLSADEYFSRPAPKSTGREHFNLRWLEDILRQRNRSALSAPDVQRTLVALTARTVVAQISRYLPDCSELILCGGGAFNPLLVSDIGAIAPEMRLRTSAQLGVPVGAVEAMAFAWLAYRRITGLPGNMPSVTGARESVLLGGIYAPH